MAAAPAEHAHALEADSGLWGWITWPFEYIGGYFGSPRPTTPPGKGPASKRTAAATSAAYDDEAHSAHLEEWLPALVGATDDPMEHEHSIHGVFVPPHIEDWTAFAASLPDVAYPRYRMVLPKKTKILALDLDETLVHSTSRSSGDCDYFVEVLVDRCSCLYYVFKRPFVDQFLETVSNWYHLVIYTASLREYAEPVVNWLDRGRGLFKKRLYRTACIEQMGLFIKNLTLVDPDLSRVCLLDNSLVSFAMHPGMPMPFSHVPPLSPPLPTGLCRAQTMQSPLRAGPTIAQTRPFWTRCPFSMRYAFRTTCGASFPSVACSRSREATEQADGNVGGRIPVVDRERRTRDLWSYALALVVYNLVVYYTCPWGRKQRPRPQLPSTRNGQTRGSAR